MPIRTMLEIVGRDGETERRRDEVVELPRTSSLRLSVSPSPPPTIARFSAHTCSTICPADRFPFTPFTPLAQKRHWTGQPTCELMHAVRRGPSGIITVSAFAPPGHSSRSLRVPSLLD